MTTILSMAARVADLPLRQSLPRANANAAAEKLVALMDLPQEVRDAHQRSQDVLAQLEQAGKAMVADRKGAAEQKLEQARAKLAMLRMYGGDPKAIARQAKEIAREIREAAREYGAALKAEGGGAGTAAMPMPAAGEQAAPQAGGEADPGAAEAQGPQAPRPEDPNAAARKPEAADPKAADPEAERERVAATYREAAAEIAAQGARAQGQRETIDKFKQATDEARRVIEDAIRKLKEQKQDGALVDELTRAKDSMARAVEALDGAASEAGAGVPGTVPLVDILV